MALTEKANTDTLAKQYFIDLSADNREDTNKNLGAWLWFTCPASLRDAVREAILALRLAEAERE